MILSILIAASVVINSAKIAPVPATFDNQVLSPALESTPQGERCGLIDTWNCRYDCLAAGPFASGGNILSVLVGVDCVGSSTPGQNICGCHWQPIGIGVGGINAPCVPQNQMGGLW